MRTHGLAMGIRGLGLSIVMLGAVLLSSCGGGGGGGGPVPVTNANPNGYYDNTGTLTLTDTTDPKVPAVIDSATNLQGFVNNNRLLMFATGSSSTVNYTFDSDITISGNSISGTATVYVNAAPPFFVPNTGSTGTPLTVSLTGTIDQGKTIKGTMTGQLPGTTTLVTGKADFTLNYSTSVNAQSVKVADLVNTPITTGKEGWYVDTPVGNVNIGGSAIVAFRVKDSTGIIGRLTQQANGPAGAFYNCAFDTATSSILTNASYPALFDVYFHSRTLSCPDIDYPTVQLDYSGFATMRTDSVGGTPVNRLVMIMTNRPKNGVFALSGEFINKP